VCLQYAFLQDFFEKSTPVISRLNIPRTSLFLAYKLKDIGENIRAILKIYITKKSQDFKFEQKTV
jgi:hypothetical protein